MPASTRAMFGRWIPVRRASSACVRPASRRSSRSRAPSRAPSMGICAPAPLPVERGATLEACRSKVCPEASSREARMASSASEIATMSEPSSSELTGRFSRADSPSPSTASTSPSRGETVTNSKRRPRLRSRRRASVRATRSTSSSLRVMRPKQISSTMSSTSSSLWTQGRAPAARAKLTPVRRSSSSSSSLAASKTTAWWRRASPPSSSKPQTRSSKPCLSSASRQSGTKPGRSVTRVTVSFIGPSVIGPPRESSARGRSGYALRTWPPPPHRRGADIAEL